MTSLNKSTRNVDNMLNLQSHFVAIVNRIHRTSVIEAHFFSRKNLHRHFSVMHQLTIWYFILRIIKDFKIDNSFNKGLFYGWILLANSKTEDFVANNTYFAWNVSWVALLPLLNDKKQHNLNFTGEIPKRKEEVY